MLFAVLLYEHCQIEDGTDEHRYAIQQCRIGLFTAYRRVSARWVQNESDRLRPRSRMNASIPCSISFLAPQARVFTKSHPVIFRLGTAHAFFTLHSRISDVCCASSNG